LKPILVLDRSLKEEKYSIQLPKNYNLKRFWKRKEFYMKMLKKYIKFEKKFWVSSSRK
jgi:hypothetical protein